MGKLLTEEAGNAVEIDEDRRAGQAHVSVGTRLCPPAKSFASPSPPASRARAPTSVSGRAQSNPVCRSDRGEALSKRGGSSAALKA